MLCNFITVFVFTGIQTSSQLHRVYKWHGECFRAKLLYPRRMVGAWYLGRTLIYIWRYRVTWGYLQFVSSGERGLLESILTISVPLNIFGNCSSLKCISSALTCPSYTDTGPTFSYGNCDTPPHLVAFCDTLGMRRTYSRLEPSSSSRGYVFNLLTTYICNINSLRYFKHILV